MAELPSKRRIESFVKPFRVTDGRRFKLKDVDPRSTAKPARQGKKRPNIDAW